MKTLRSIAFALCLLPLAAFAGERDLAESRLTEAQTALDAAQSADAPQYATAEFQTAKAMLSSARASADDRDWEDALLAAEKARTDADLATARSRQVRAEGVTAELESMIATLRAAL